MVSPKLLIGLAIAAVAWRGLLGMQVLDAAAARDADGLRWALRWGGSANALAWGGERPLMKALRYRRRNWSCEPGKEPRLEPVVAALLEAGADPDRADRDGRTALMYAIDSGETFETLIAKADASRTDARGWTALHHAIDRGQSWYARRLLDGTKPGLPLPHAAVVRGDRTEVERLAAGGALAALDPATGRTPLHVAATLAPELGELLLAKGARIDVRDRDGLTPLHLAARAGSAGLVKALLARGAGVNGVDSGGSTALMLAAMTPDRDTNPFHRLGLPPDNPAAEIVKLLLAHGAKADARDAAGRTARDLAVSDVIRGALASGR